uniref:Uncharacterized protein n=1 Tax=Mimivirus LCMiAC02 TaxID=2506609 RepID=A0A481Z0L1_9VIRU|nr:MAG: hypothetical protein LCMiAC02_01350 [Mimivirus LCMiAC02]
MSETFEVINNDDVLISKDMIGREMKLSAEQIAKYKIYSPGERWGTTYELYDSADEKYYSYKFQVQTCMGSKGFYYITIYKKDDILISKDMIGREMKLSSDQIAKYRIECHSSDRSSKENGLYDSIDKKYYSYKFQVRSRIWSEGFYYLTIHRKDDITKDMIGHEMKFSAEQISKYNVFFLGGRTSKKNELYDSKDPRYSSYKFQVRSCIGDSKGFYYLTIHRKDDITKDMISREMKLSAEQITKDMIGREMKLSAEQISKYNVCFPIGRSIIDRSSKENGLYDSIDKKYSSYKFQVRSCIGDSEGFYYITIHRKDDI